MSTKSPNPTDRYVGMRIRLQRITLKMSQEKLGDALGLTFQQVQKYEKGSNRVGASRLQQISSVLKVPVSYFFEGGPSESDLVSGLGEPESTSYFADFLATSDGVALTQAFAQIKDAKLRRAVVNLVELIAAQDPRSKK